MEARLPVAEHMPRGPSTDLDDPAIPAQRIGGATESGGGEGGVEMPFLLKARDVSADVSDVRSVLIVPCRFCPAASFAVTEKKPYIELFRTFSRTPAYEQYVKGLKAQLANAGIKADVFDNKRPQHFILCMWPSGRRKKLSERASEYDAIVVLGCDSAVKTVQDALPSDGARVISGMQVEGIMSVTPSFRFPGNISLEMSSVTRVLDHRSRTSEKRVPADV